MKMIEKCKMLIRALRIKLVRASRGGGLAVIVSIK
jgi:hypothetical protein